MSLYGSRLGVGDDQTKSAMSANSHELLTYDIRRKARPEGGGAAEERGKLSLGGESANTTLSGSRKEPATSDSWAINAVILRIRQFTYQRRYVLDTLSSSFLVVSSHLISSHLLHLSLTFLSIKYTSLTIEPHLSIPPQSHRSSPISTLQG